MPFTHVALGSNPAPSTNFLTMKKGDIIWILYNNCLYCSEIEDITTVRIGYDDNVIKDYKDVITLIPIVGDITYIELRIGQNCVGDIVITWVYGGKQRFPYPGAQISCNFDLISRYIKTNNSK